MEALAGYDSDDDNYEKQDYEKDSGKKCPRIAGDNYDNVQMDLSEENSSGSSSKAGGSSRYSGSRDSEDKYASRSDRGSNARDDRHLDSRRDYKKAESKRKSSPHDDRKRKYSPERREKKRSSEREKRRGSDDKERRRESPERRQHRHKTEERLSKSSRHSKSPSRRGSRSHECKSQHKKHARSRSPISKKPESTSSSGGKDESPPAMTSEQYLASINLAQKLAQQVQPSRAAATSIAGLPGLAGNPTVTKIQEQLQKRRMLWQQAKIPMSASQPETKEVPGQSNNNWEGALLPKDDDGKMTAKFKRLMGIKGASNEASSSAPVAAAPNAQEQLKKQDDMFNNMERQYEVARLATHTHRGLGLGFGAFQCNPR